MGEPGSSCRGLDAYQSTRSTLIGAGQVREDRFRAIPVSSQGKVWGDFKTELFTESSLAAALLCVLMFLQVVTAWMEFLHWILTS